MKKIGIGIDYSNICKGYNTVYLDRDNTDRETKTCMRKVIAWIEGFLSSLMEQFNFNIYRLNNATTLDIGEIARNRFLFYSLEKEMLLQSFILESEYVSYPTLAAWGQDSVHGLLIKNDDEGEGLYLYVNENSALHQWILEQLKEFSLEEIAFEEK